MRLNMPRYAVTHRACTLGVARRKEKPWSKKEVSYLRSKISRLSMGVLAKHLGRTVTAVALKSKRLSIKKTAEGYTARGVALGFGIDVHIVTRWIGQGLLQASKRGTRKKHDMYFITDCAIKKFVRTYPTEFDMRKVDQVWFIEVLVGVKNGANKGGKC